MSKLHSAYSGEVDWPFRRNVAGDSAESALLSAVPHRWQLPKTSCHDRQVRALIIGDFAIAPIGPRERNDLLVLLDDRLGTRACIVTSQLPVNYWHDCIGDPTLADAILDGLVHRAHRIGLEAKESMRKREAAKETAKAKARAELKPGWARSAAKRPFAACAADRACLGFTKLIRRS